MKVSRSLLVQYVTISEASINTFTVLAMVHYDSPRFDLLVYAKIMGGRNLKKKIQQPAI